LGSIDLRRLSAPTPLAPEHELEDFRCAEATLETWLRQRARNNEAEGASRAYVVAAGKAVVGYYCLSAGAVAHDRTSAALRKNMPNPISVIVLGRLAVHSAWTGHGIGEGLLKDAILRAIAAAEGIGVRALLCHAISPEAKGFYLKHGFVESPVDPMTLMLNLSRLTR